jgi:hypothetical protein
MDRKQNIMTEKAKQLANEYVNAPENYDFGLTKREYFAAMAMQGLLTTISQSDANWKIHAKTAVLCADSLLEELSKE